MSLKHFLNHTSSIKMKVLEILYMPYMKYDDIVKFDFTKDSITLREFTDVIKIRMMQYLGQKMKAFDKASGLQAFAAAGMIGGVGTYMEGDEINNIEMGDAASFNIFDWFFN